jgi:hypothetical protein
MKPHLKTLSILSIACALPATGATTFSNDPGTAGGAKWDTWSQESATVTTGLNQGSAQTTFGSTTISDSSVTTDITQDYNSFIGGLTGGGDRYYFHDGAATWNASLIFTSAVDFVRVSYSLLGGEMGAPTPYGLTPVITNGTVLDSGSYASGDTLIFYTDFALDSPSTEIETSFGDNVFPMFPCSFRSVDAIQVEGLNSAPTAVPEPSAGILALLAGSFLLRRKRTRS